MKRKSNLYKNICNIDNIIASYDEVCRNTNNKRKVFNMKQYRAIYISRIYDMLNNEEYVVGPYNKFIIYEPKERQIVSQGICDKIVNHLVARYILYPAILPCLLDVNVASRKNMGTSAGLKYEKEFFRKCKIKYKKFYILKCDISKFFASIDHQILKEKILRRIKDKKAIKIIFDIIDSADKGLYIGSMTSQVLAIFYLNDVDHFIKEKLKIKYYIRYQDDFLLFHPSKEYLKYSLKKIRSILKAEKLILNPKTRIYQSTNNFIFLGRTLKGKYAKYRSVKRRIKKKHYLYNEEKLTLNNYVSSLINFDEILLNH